MSSLHRKCLFWGTEEASIVSLLKYIEMALSFNSGLSFNFGLYLNVTSVFTLQAWVIRGPTKWLPSRFWLDLPCKYYIRISIFISCHSVSCCITRHRNRWPLPFGVPHHRVSSLNAYCRHRFGCHRSISTASSRLLMGPWAKLNFIKQHQ